MHRDLVTDIPNCEEKTLKLNLDLSLIVMSEWVYPLSPLCHRNPSFDTENRDLWK